MSDFEHAGVLSRLHLEKKGQGLRSHFPDCTWKRRDSVFKSHFPDCTWKRRDRVLGHTYQTAPGKEGFKSCIESTVSGAFQSSLGRKGQF
jgi:hypothetical protein